MSTVTESAKEAYDKHEWLSAFELFTDADAANPLGAEDLERFAWASRWSGHFAEEVGLLERAERAYAEIGDRPGAARMAIHLGASAYSHGRVAVAAGCFARAVDSLADLPEGREHALLAFMNSMGLLSQGDTASARKLATQALDIAKRVGAKDLEALAKLSLGHVSLSQGETKAGIALHDEASGAAMTGTLGPWASGFIYCSVIVACRNRADWRRAAEWTERTASWCRSDANEYYPGLCRVHRAEVLRFKGAYEDAEKSALAAKEILMQVTPLSAGWAEQEIAEICLRRGDLDGAKEACQRAIELGTEPQPVLAKLQLAEGDAAGALRSIDAALQSTTLFMLEGRVNLLPAKVTIALAMNELGAAREALGSLEELAAELDTPAPMAAACQARGELELKSGNAQQACDAFRRAWRLWWEIEAPYDAARSQALLADASVALGDLGGAVLQLKAAQANFERVGASADGRRAAERLAAVETQRDLSIQDGKDSERSLKTFMFTDIVDSTKLVDVLGDDSWDALLQWHNRTLRDCFENRSGEEAGSEGDGFFVAFDDAAAALECAVEIQRILAKHRVEHGFAPQVRIGLHTAEALKRGGDYAGKGVHTAARIGAAGGAGDILASTDTVEAAPDDFEVSRPRELELKGLSVPVRVVSVQWRSDSR